MFVFCSWHSKDELRDFTEEEKVINGEIMKELEEKVASLTDELEEKSAAYEETQRALNELTLTSSQLVSGLEQELKMGTEDAEVLREMLSQSITTSAVQSILAEERLASIEVGCPFSVQCILSAL